MKNVPENELFSAYLDGELSAEEQAQVERLLATSPQARQLLESLRTLSATLQSLPAHKIGEDLSQSVLRLAERRMLGASPAATSPPERSEPSEPAELPASRDTLRPEELTWRPSLRRLLRPRNLVFPAAAVVIALLFALTDRFGGNPPGARRVAMAPSAVPEDREEAARADRRSGAAESPVIGPLRKAERRANRKAAESVLPEEKPEAEMFGVPTVSSTPVNVVPSVGSGRGGAMPAMEASSTDLAGATSRAPARHPAELMLKMERGLEQPDASSATPLAMPAPMAKKAAMAKEGGPESPTQPPMPALPADVAALKQRAKDSLAREAQVAEAKADHFAGKSKPAEMRFSLKAGKSQLDLSAPSGPRPALVVRCDVNRPADARKLLEQVLAKQRIALGDRKRFESEPIDSVKSRDGERSRVSSDEKKSVPLGSALGRDGGHFEVEVSLAQLQQALVELQGHPDVFASCSLESPLPPAALGRVVAGSEKALKGQASGEEPRIAKKPPTATQSLDQDASMSRALEESPLPLDAPQTTAGGLLGGQSQRPVRSHLTQQVTPTQQMPAGTSQAGVAGQMVPLSSPADRGKIADDSLREGGGRVAAKADKASPAYQPFRQKEQQPLATQALSDGAKQRVVFLFRLVPSAAAAEAVRVAGPEKTKAAAKGEAVQAAKGIQRAAEPAKPAAATSPLPAANNAADSPK